MNRKSQRGVALVITLIMLSIVLIMAVLFLGISRRERTSVTGAVELTTARNAAEYGQTRALAKIIAPIIAKSNLLAFGMVVSTNLINPNGFQPGVSSFDNVSYSYATGLPLSGNDIRINQANLYYDPRPPVFVVTNFATRESEFRFYLDLNRNGRFDTNGYQPVISANGQRTGQASFYFGDPEWIGILEHPDQPHSGSNRFIARYAFLVVPAGRTLDINYIHNNARDPAPALPPFNLAFSRNQGVGSWEINLAAFFRDLNTNYWLGDPIGYHYDPSVAGPSTARGTAFQDALSNLVYRCQGDFRTLRSVQQLYPAGGASFRNDLIDEYGDDRPLTGLRLSPEGSPTVPTVLDDITKPWFGSENTNGFTRIDELFDSNKTSPLFVNRLRLALIGPGTDNQNTFYRLMAQLGTDSLAANRGKLNLNYDNVNLETGQIDPSVVTGLTNWTPIRFFTNAADLMLRSQSSTILSSFGVTATNFTLSVTNIPIYPANLYLASVHRLLQLAANIHDSTTNRFLLAAGTNSLYAPSVFRPLFGRRGTNIFISGFEEVTGTNTLRDPWVDLNVPALAFSRITESNPTNHVNVYGIPYVIGAKKGLPNFNEFLLRTSVQVTRRLEARKDGPLDPLGVRYRQSYQFAITNTLGLEAWNSYTQTFAGPLTLILTNSASRVIMYGTTPLRVPDPFKRLIITNNITTNAWAGWNPGDVSGPSFRVPMDTNVATFPEGAVLSDGTIQPAGTNSISFEPLYNKFPVPDLKLYITNRLVYALVAKDVKGVPRLVDFVNLDRMIGGMDIMRELVGQTNAFGDVGLHPGSFWITNHLGGPNAMTWGITNQIFVSTNDALAKGDWTSYSDDPTAGLDKPKAVDNFRKLLGLLPIFDTSDTNVTYGTFQVPFTPTRKLDQKLSWQANDPLVHYHIEDLSDRVLTSVTNLQVLRPSQLPEPSNIGQLNDPRYRPWGGNPKNLPGSRPLVDYDLAVKDPLIFKSDDWDFPTNKFPNIGWLGRVHRGTPWQTVYLKSQVEKLAGWVDWAGQAGRADTHPTNDWHLLSLFTTAPNDAAARGLLSVNQTNIAAWSAVLSGVPVISNGLANLFIEPASPQLYQIVSNINATRLQMPNQVFPDLGSVLRSPALTVASPFLNTSVARAQQYPLISDELYERIPQQVLSLLKDDEPYVVIYAFGQSLKPASDSIVTAPGAYRGLCTNYQVTAEVATKTAVRIEETRQPNNRPNLYKAVVESYSILPTD